jgi:hypothetical protein
MPKGDDRFRSLDEVPAPDLWADASTREPGRTPRAGRSTGAVVSVVALVALIAAVALLARNLTTSVPAESPRSSEGATSPTATSPTATTAPLPALPESEPVTRTGTSSNGAVRCSATIDRTILEPGEALAVTFVIENVGDHPITYSRGSSGDQGTVRILDAGGTILWDQLHAEAPHSEPAPIPEKLEPGERANVGTTTVVIRWAGRLEVSAACPLGIGALNPVPLAIAPPGPAPAIPAAIQAAVDATGGLYAHCSPEPDGSAASGSISAPDGDPGVPPLSAICWADVDAEDGLVDVTLHFASPSDLGQIVVPEASFVRLVGDGPLEASTWPFVVTARGAVAANHPVSESKSGPDLWTVDYFFDGTTWSGGGCSAPGGEEYGGGVELFRPDSCFGA